MAALRLLARTKLSAIILRPLERPAIIDKAAPIVLQVHKRWGTYKSSPIYKDPSHYTDYEVTRDPKEWEYVERLLKPKTVPVPPLENKKLPSGWKPPVAKQADHPYYVQRTKNYMIPVYMGVTFRGTRRITTVRKIHGNIWALESELRTYLEKQTNKVIGVRVNELIGEIQFRGDHVSLVKKWLDEKGF
ncbi:mitochondrial ribosomal protein L49 [Andrena cerasifolii]|uniref:mitochondrial ribosomal protein L49 n=1 Tax=Andrena cerasifolii TaxID=2819439 RepID=UPI0040383842